MKKVKLSKTQGSEWRVSYPSWNGRISEHYQSAAEALIRYLQLRFKKSEHGRKHR
jgi:hypothetical protein